ncbi:MAG: guanylate kinase [Bacteroidota bacterium]|nr:guanylate kinase [Candidatus Kapabacteria bacterium]MDW8219066.1 guanylate kinase [Bacteroidota bacterium]
MVYASNSKRLFVFSAPSGAGKTTIARHLLDTYAFMQFSVSATTRPRREHEVDGKDYYFLSVEEFEAAIQRGELIEYERIFGNYYGTLRSEVERALAANKVLVFDIDVNGALSLQKAYPRESLLIFVAPPSMEVLAQRLRARNTESQEQLALRLARAEMELQQQSRFDEVIVNDDLNRAFAHARCLVERYAMPLQC